MGLLPTITSEPIVDPGLLTMLVYTFTGAGKSTFCSRVEGVVIVQLEPRLKGIKAPKTPLIQSWTELENVYTELAAGGHPYRAVALDTVTDAYRLCAEHILKKKGVDHETEMGSHGEGYGRINREFYRLIRKFAGLPYGLIMTAHVRDVEVKARTEKYTRKAPDLPDTPRGALMGLADFVLFGDTLDVPDLDEKTKEQKVDENGKLLTKEVRVLRTKWSKTWDAKDGYSVLPDIIPLSYPAFLKEFNKGVSEKKAFSGAKGAGALPKKGGQTGQSGQATQVSQAAQVAQTTQVQTTQTTTKDPSHTPEAALSADDVTQGSTSQEPIKNETTTEAKTEAKADVKTEIKEESKTEAKAGTEANSKSTDTPKAESKSTDTKTTDTKKATNAK